MAETKNPLPDDLYPVGEICIPVQVPNNTQWLWTLIKAVSFPTLKRYWSLQNATNNEIMRKEWESRVYTPLVEAVLNQAFCAEQEIDNCLEYNNAAPFLSYTPQNPHTEPDFVPDGYLSQPFFKFGSIVPESLPDWLEDFVGDWLTDMTGYEENDVLTVINSFPIFASWEDILTSGLPRITVEFSGVGIVQIRLLLVPFGGRAIVTIDIEPNIADIISGIFDGQVRSIELERDLSSIPLETDIDHIEEIVLTEDIEHTIYITFLPVVDVTLLPLKYGGGIRSITFCGEFAFEEVPTVECDIPTIIADDTYFEETYVPVVFGEYYSETVSHYETLLAAHDDTPQSVAPLVPVAAPGAIEDNALCYAVNRFVELYASQKTCLIQSQNFIETLWSDFANAANDFYNAATNLMMPLYSPNIFSCFVDDTAALTALADTAAHEELACFLFDELSSVAMSQSNFDDAILAAATTLTGNAQDIACLMQNDNSESIYISFLQGYNIALERQAENDELECPCLTDTYWMMVWDFSANNGAFVEGLSSGREQSLYDGSKWRNRSSNPPNNAWTMICKNFDREYVIKAMGMDFSALGFTGVGSDSVNMGVFTESNRSGTSVTFLNQTFFTVDGANIIRNGYLPANATGTKCLTYNVFNSGAPTGSNYSYIHRVVAYGLPASGVKPAGSVWVSAVPTSPTSLFP